MKKIVALVLAMVLCLSFAACGETKENANPATAADDAAASGTLVGSWLSDRNAMIINEDGSAIINATSYRWTAADGVFTLIQVSTDERFTYPYVLSGNTLSITVTDGTTVTYNRVVE